MTFSITDNDVAGITVLDSPMVLAEGGATDTFRVQLSSQPTANVTVSLSTSDSQTSFLPTSLTFTSVNWNVPQTVTVTAVDDGVVEGNHTGIVNLTSSSSDTNYSGKTGSASAAITDNDTATITFFDTDPRNENEPVGTVLTTFARITYSAGASSLAASLSLTVTPTGTSGDPATFNVDYSQTTLSVTFAPTAINNSTQPIDFSVIDDLITEPTEQFTFSFTSPTSSVSNMLTQITSSDTQVVNIIDNDLANITINIVGGTQPFPLDENQTLFGEYSMNLATVPDAPVVINFEDTSGQCIFFVDGNGPTSGPISSDPITNNVTTVTIQVYANDDLIVEADPHPCTITHTLTTTATGYVSYSVPDITGSIIENDLPGLDIVGEPDLISETGPTSDTFQVRLLSQPTANVVVSFTSTDGQTTVTSSLTFTPSNWDTYQNVTVTAVDDLIAEASPHVGNIGITTSSSDLLYNGLTDTASANITDNDTGSATSTGSPSVTEGVMTGQSYSLNINGTSAFSATTDITADADCLISLSASGPWSATLTAVNIVGGTPTLVFVRAYDDKIVEGAHTCTITHTNTVSGTPTFNNRPIDNVTANVTDNDSATYQFSAATSSIGEATTSTTPTVTFTFDVTGEDVGESASLTAAITIPVAITGGTAGGGGTDCNCTINDVTVDTSGTVTLQPTLGGLLDDRLLEGDETFNLGLGIETSASPAQNAVVTLGTPNTHVITVTDNESAIYGLVRADGVVSSTTASESVTSASIGMLLQVVYNGGSGPIGIASTFSVGYTQTGGSATSGGVDYSFTNGSVSFNPGDTFIDGGGYGNLVKLINFTVVDDSIAEATETIVFTADPNETGTSGAYDTAISRGALVDTHTYTILDNDTPSISVVQTGGTTDIAEAGATTDTYTLTLSNAAGGVTANTTITAGADCEVSINGTDFFPSLVAALSNSATTITVRAVNDNILEAATHPCLITHSNTSGSSVSVWNGVSIGDVTANVTDNESAEISFPDNDTNIAEGAATTTIARLTIISDGTGTPGIDADISVAINNTAGSASVADYDVTTTSVTFTAGSYAGGTVNQNVSFDANEDSIAENSETFTISFGTITSTLTSVTLVPGNHVVTIIDNDTAGGGGGTGTGGGNGTGGNPYIVAEQGATSNTFTYTLTSQPTADVITTFSTNGETEISIDGGATFGTSRTFTFTSGNWDTGVSIIVRAINDLVFEGGTGTFHDGDITVDFDNGSLDSFYAGLANQTIFVDVEDNETPPSIVVNYSGTNTPGGPVAVSESGTTDTFEVTLNTDPGTGNTITVTVFNGPDTTTDFVTLTFTGGSGGTWNTYQTVTVTAVNDNLVEGTETPTIALTADGGYASATVNVTVTDDETLTYSFGADADGLENVNGSYVLNLQIGGSGTGSYGITTGFTVNYTVAGSATSGTDYTALSGTISVPNTTSFDGSGLASISTTIDVTNDTIDEPDETIILTSTGITGGAGTISAGDTTFTYTIVDNDTPGVTFTGVDNGTTTLLEATANTDTYTVQIGSTPASGDVTITIDPDADCEVSINGSAFGTSGTITTNDPLAVFTVVVRAFNDQIIEGSPHSCAVSYSFDAPGDSFYDNFTRINDTYSITDNDSAFYDYEFAETGSATEGTNGGHSIHFHYVTDGFGPIEFEAPITLGYSISGLSTATGGGVDHSFTAGTVTFPVNGTPQPFTITPIINDAFAEDPETIIVVLDEFESSGLARQDAVVTRGLTFFTYTHTILDNDTPVITLTQSGGTTNIAEAGATTDTYTITLTNADAGVTAQTTISAGADCEVSLDGTTFSSSVVATLSNSATTITVRAIDDRIVEGAHTCLITHSNTSGSSVSVWNGRTIGNVTANVTDNDTATFQFVSATGSNSENLSGTATVEVVFNTTGTGLPSTATLESAITVNYTVADVTATGGGVDYSLANGSVVIPTSGASQNITITVFNDTVDESDESLTITLNGTETGGTPAQQAAVTPGGNSVFTYTILDNDTAGVTFTGVDTGTALNEGSATGDTYTVQLDSTPPTGDAIIIIDPDNDCEISIEGSAFGTSGTITTNGLSPFTIEIRPVNDRIVEGSLHTCSVSYDFSTSTSSQYSGLTRSPDIYNINDNDTATYQFAVSSDSVTEGTGVGTTTVNVAVTTSFNTGGGSIPPVGSDALETAIQIPYTIGGASTATGGGTDYTITASPITIPTSGATQNIVVNVNRDSITEANETLILNLGVESGGSSGQQAAVTQGGTTTHTLTINDDDQPAINLTGVGLTSTDNSGGPLGPIDENLTTTDTYTIALNSTPGALVTIGITSGPDCYFNINGGGFGNSGTINTSSITPFTIVLRAVNDRIVEGAHSCTVNYTVGSADPNYDQGSNPSIVPAPYTYDIVDNDSATYQFVLASSSIPENATPAVLSVSTTFTTSGEAGFTTPTFESAFITVPFTITGTATGGGTDYSMASSVTIPNTGTTQNVFVTIVNDIIDELDETVIVTLGDETVGTIAQQAVVTIGSPSVHTLTILDDDSTPGINVTGVNTGIVFDEANHTTTTDSFDIQLNSVPTANVQIVLTAAPDCEVSVSAVNPVIAPTSFGSSVTMTTNSAATIFTVVARPYNDRILEGNHTCALTYKVDSTDNNYDDDVTPAIRPATQTYSVLDNEVGDYGMVYLPTPLAFTSSSSGSEATTPANTVSVFFAINGTGVGPVGFDQAFSVGYSVTGGTATNGGVDYNLPAGSVTFDPGTAVFFSNVTSILVPFPVVNDAIDEVDETVIITAAANETGTSGSYDTAIFRTLSVPFQSHPYTILDNDTAGVNVNVGGGVTATEGGSGGSFTVVLNSQPTSDVTITYTTSDGQTTTVSTITFTSLNWNVPQVVNVTAVNDGIAEGTHTGVISWTSSSGDSNYNGTFSSTVNVTITDNDPAVVTITGGGAVNVVEGGATSSYQLNMNAASGVTATTTVSGGANCLVSLDGITYSATVNATLSGSALTTIYVQAIDDTVLEGAHTCTLTHTNLVSGSSVWNGVAISNVTGNVTDNESATITYTAGGSATEGGSGSGTVNLVITANGVPNTGTLGANVTVAITNTAGSASVSDYSVTTPSITFTSGSSSGSQSVNYTGTDDQTVEGSETFTLGFGAVTTTISTGVTASGTTTATVNDNDTATITYTAGPDVSEGSSNSGTVTLTINATGTGTVQLGYDVTVAITNTNGTAGGGDYGVGTSSVTFTAGSGTGATQSVTYTGTNDAFAEGTENFSLGFGTVTSTASSQITATGTQSVNVLDTDTATVTNVGGNSVVLSELNETTHDSYTLAINPQPGVSATTVVTAGADCLVSLSAGSGYASSVTATLTDSTPTTIYVRPYDDRIVEGDGQTCLITHGNLVSASPVFNGLAVANVTATVADDDFGAYGFEFPWTTSHAENAGTFPIGAYITFLTDGVGTDADSRLEVPMTVPVAYTGSATGSGTDYTGFATITFPITTADGLGQLWVDSNFTIVNDNLVEGTENAILTMGAGTSTPAQQANLVLDVGISDVRTVTITDNDSATITYTAGPDVAEGASNSGTATLTLTTNGTGPAQLASTVSVIVTNTAGTATVGDYSVVTSNITFNAGATSGTTASVTYTGTNDAFAEETETFSLGFGAITTTMTGSPVTATGSQSVNVLDTDTPTLTNGAGIINLSEATATTSGSYTLSINAQPGTSYTTLVSADVDTLVSLDNVNFFSSVNATLTNSTATTIYVRPVNDQSVEGNHTGTVTHGPLVLVSGSNVFVGQTFSNTVVSITDNDSAVISFSSASSTVAEGATSTGLTVQLTIIGNGSGTPGLGAPVTVALTATDGTAIASDYSLNTASVTFPADSLNDAVLAFSYSGQNDAYAEPSPENFTIGFGTVTTTISSGVSTSGTHTGNITDTDTATITVTDASGSTDISEAVSTPDSYTIQLNAQPSDNYMTTITAGADCEISLSIGGPYSGSVMATISGSTPTTIYVRAINDNIIEGNHTCLIDNGTLVGGSPFNGLSITDVTANVADNDSATVSFSALSNTIAEPNSGSVNAVLTYVTNGTGPASLDTTITVGVTNSVGTALVTDYTVSTSSVSFTAGALNGATQAINYSATNDSYAEDNETFNVNFGAVTGPATADLQTHVVTITDAGDAVSITVAPNDDDVAPVGNELQVNETGTTVDTYVITLNIEPGYTATTNISAGVDCLVSTDGISFSPTLTGVTLGASTVIYVRAVDDAYAETTPHPCLITHSNLTSSVSRFNGQAVASITANVIDNDVPTVVAVADDDDVAPAGNEIRVSEVNLALTDTYTITMNAVPGLTATTVVTADVNCLVSIDNVTFTSSVTATLVGSTPTVVYVRAANDQYDEPTLHSCGINHGNTSSATAPFNNVPVNPVVGEVEDNDTFGVNIVQTGGTTDVAEGGANDTYSFQLTSVPFIMVAGSPVNYPQTSQVNVLLSTSAQCQISTDGITFAQSLLRSLNTTGVVTVTVRAVDDLVIEGPHSCPITHVVSSPDPAYNTLIVPDVNVSIADNDGAGVIITPLSVNVVEGGSTSSYSVVLASQPAADVIINIGGTGTQANASSTTLTFTPSNYNVAQVVTVTAIDDNVAEGAHSATFTHTLVTTDPNYNALGALPSVAVNITDNDTVGVVVAQTSGNTVVQEGTQTDTYSVVLTSQPTSDVTITIGGLAGQVSVGSTTLTFTPANWNVAQIVTVTAVDDNVDEENQTTITLTHTATSGDSNYNGISVNSVPVLVVDNDVAAVIVTPNAVSVTEGGATGTYSVVLATQPTANVTVTVVDSTQATANSTTLTFTPVNWNIAQNVIVTAVNDTVTEGAHVTIFTHSASSSDAVYNGISVGSVQVNITDNDSVGLAVAQSGGNTAVSETGPTTDTYTIGLNSTPSSAVSVTVTADPQCTVSSDGITFGSSATISLTNLTAQTITVRAVDDPIVEVTPHPCVLTHSVTSADPNYNGLPISNITVQVTDNDIALPTVNAVDDTASTSVGSAVSVAVLGNDTYTGGVTITIESAPANGTAIPSGMTINYTHIGVGPTVDTFTYRITDSNGTFDIATVTVNVAGPSSQVTNGGFESGSPIPTGFTIVNRNNSGVVCSASIAHTGNCALVIYGARTPTVAKQTLANPTPGQEVTIETWVKWSSVRPGGYAQVRVFFTDGTTQIIGVTVPVSPATQSVYQFLTFTGSVQTGKTVLKTELWIGYAATSGSVTFDDVAVTYGAIVPPSLPATTREGALPAGVLGLPTPSAPDGFRGNN